MSLRIFWDNFIAHSEISYICLSWKTVFNPFKANFDIIQKPFANQFTNFYGTGDAGLKCLTLFCVTRESLYKDPKLSQLLIWEIEVDNFYSVKTDSMCKGITLNIVRSLVQIPLMIYPGQSVYVNYGDTKPLCEICSNLTIKISERRH